MRVLLLDDDQLSLCSSEDALSMNGHECESLLTPDKAIVGYDVDRFDLIISGICMLKMSVVEFYRKVCETCSKVRIILINGFSRMEMALSTFKGIAFDILEKPLDFAKLMDILRGLEEKLDSKTAKS